MTDDTSARLGLPLLQPGQAQKEMTHNEALALLDIAVQARAIAIGTTTPPSDAMPGDCWIVGADPDGAWSGSANCLAGWTAGGWRFVPSVEGMTVWIEAEGTFARFLEDTWIVGEVTAARMTIGGLQVIGPRASAIADPDGGVAIDAEARAAVSAILATLRGHGLIAT